MPTIDDKLIEEVRQNSPLRTTLELAGIGDTDLLSIAKAMTDNTYVKEIFIREHNLTNDSYPVLLDLVKDHPSITRLQFKLIMPPSAGGGMCNEAISRMLARNKERTQQESQLLFHDVTKAKTNPEKTSIPFSPKIK